MLFIRFLLPFVLSMRWLFIARRRNNPLLPQMANGFVAKDKQPCAINSTLYW